MEFFNQEAVASFGIIFADHHTFAQYEWYSTALGKNYLIRLGENFIYHALVHKSGAHILKYPLSMLEFDREEYRVNFEQGEILNPPMDFDLPEAFELKIQLFRREYTDELLDFDYQPHRAIKNFYYGFKDGCGIGMVFVENHVMVIGIDANLLVN